VGTYLSQNDAAIICREADAAARRLARQFRLLRYDREDLYQDLLVDLIGRLKRFDPARGKLGAFAATVAANYAGRLAGRIRRERAVFAAISLDDPTGGDDASTIGESIAEADGYLAFHGQATDVFAQAERRLDLERALSSLDPSNLHLLVQLSEKTPHELSKQGVGARASMYRRIGNLRLELLAFGISAAV
jgi:RNA polymerase sigma factor (sigma-70 family)